MDHYQTLGIDKTATADEIKKAYRSLAMKHHPDRGGDETIFKDISTAYEILGDEQKKQQYDLSQSGHQFNPFEFFTNGFQYVQRNTNLAININITLEEVLNGKEFNAEVNTPGGKKRMVNFSIPPGILHGQQIKYQGMGDDSIPNIPAGDLIATILVVKHHLYKREGDSLIIDRTITAWDAMLGTSIEIPTIDNRILNLKIPAGTQPDTTLSCNGEGLPNMNTKKRGNLLIKIKVKIPKNLSDDQITSIKNIAEMA